jgi:GT2 family glycosyltransferase
MSPARDVTLVIPARNAARTIGRCLDAAIEVRDRSGSRLARILLVDDGSTDGTLEAAQSRSIEALASGGRGAGAARNVGWRHAATPLVWFVDSDCVAEPEALERLLPHLDDPQVAGVSGTYSIDPRASLLERLIHEEIMVRHAGMPEETDFLATYDVVYRREVLEALDGFDERYLKGQDAEFAFRVLEAGHRLRFERASRVMHFHADRLSRYLSVQRAQGYWRVALHLEHPGRGNNRYSSTLDHLQPFVAAALVPSVLAASVATLWRGGGEGTIVPTAAWLLAGALAALLLMMQLPMTMAMMRREGPAMAWFVPLGAIRAVWRAIGLVQGVVDRSIGRGPIAAKALGRRGGPR